MSEELEGVQPRFNAEEELQRELEELAALGLLDAESARELFDRYEIPSAEREELAGEYQIPELTDDGLNIGNDPYIAGTQDNNPFGVFNPGQSLGRLADLGGVLTQTGIRAAELSGITDEDDEYLLNDPLYPTIGGTSNTSGALHLPTTTTITTVPEEPMVTGGGTPVELNPDGTPVTDTSAVSDIYDVSGTTPTNPTPGGGGGSVEFEVSPGVYIPIPEGTIGLATELLQRGVPIANLLDEINKEKNLNVSTVDNTIVPDPNTIVTPVDNTVVTPVDDTTLTNTDMTLEQEEELAELRAKNAELQSQVDNFGSLQGQGDLTTGDVATDVTTGETNLTTGETNLTTGETNLTTGETNLTTGETNVTGGEVSTDVSSTGGSGGNVTVNFGDGSGGSNAGYEKFFEMINSYIASGEPIKEGEVKGIYEQFIETSPQSAEAIRSFLALDRPVSEDQAQLKTDIYKDIIGDVREAQSPLMKSLTRRSEMQGAEAERLMGPLSFLEGRDATQAGYGQAVSGGRGLGNISGMLAGRQRAEQKNVNLQLAGNLLGQQRATAGLMADIESGIYGQMAPDIGLDFGSLLGISGVDVQNVLGERQSTRAANAAERGANIKLGIEAAPTVLGGIKTGYDWITSLGK